jgi:phage baseplate assembly protein W
MPTFIGFSTINANEPRTTNTNTGIDGGTGTVIKPLNPGKKYRLVDAQLVLQDFVNAMNIRRGQKVGQPDYGSSIWDFIFEPNTTDVQFQLQQEITRIASLDPRLILNSVVAFPQENGILVEVEIAVSPFNDAQLLSVFFDSAANKAIMQ